MRGNGKPLLVLYGTSLGTSREIAEQIAERAARISFAVQDALWAGREAV